VRLGRRLALALVLVGACERGEPSSGEGRPAAPASREPRPRIELTGCRHLDGPRCHLAADEPSTLHLWIDVQARAPLEVTIDGEPVAAESAAIEGGQRLSLVIPANAERLRLDGVDPRWTDPFELEWVRERVPAVVGSARTLALAGELERARDLLLADQARFDGRERLDVLQLLRRTHDLHDPEALRWTEEAALLAEQLGRTRDFAECAASAAFIHLQVRGDRTTARAWLRRMVEVAGELDEARVWAAYYGGLIEYRSEELGASLRHLDEARRGARRLGLVEEFLTASEQLGPALAELGRGPEALEVLADILELARSPTIGCSERARALGNAAWGHLLLAQAGLEHEPPQPLLDEQLALVDAQGECPDPVTAAFARVNGMLAALAEDEPEDAWALLGELEITQVPDSLHPWIAEIAAQIGLATGRWSLLPALVERPDPGGEPGLRYSALVRHAQTLERFGFTDAAIEFHADAEAVLEDTLSTVGIDIGRELFLAGRQASALGLVDLLVGQGRVDEALCRARLARGRALRTLDRAARLAGLSDAELAERERLLADYREVRERVAAEQLDDWRFSTSEREHREGGRREQLAAAEKLLDEALREIGGRLESLDCASLPQPAEGELLLVQFPSRGSAGEGGSWIFFADRSGIDVVAAPAASPTADWAAEALAGASDRLLAADRIRVIPTGAGWSIPFHALRFGEGVLLDVAPLVYSLDLARRLDTNPAARASALVVADPSDDLPHARREATAVTERLQAQGWVVERREGADATRSTLVDLLGNAALFHYAGHGIHGGAAGWRAALLLRDGDTLGVSDVLALPRVPQGVVLTGCDTATIAPNTLDGGMNLARAFVLAGAGWVIAAEGKVDDDLALEIGESLYRSQADPATFDAVAALRSIQLRLRDEQPERGWAAFRVIVP
jgi:tetratricopeptide (TPR) repeat protein